jgi:prophage regulatory protein
MKYMRLKEVVKLTGISRSTIYNYVKTHNFPKPLKIDSRISVWQFDDVMEWMEQHRHFN